MEGNQASPHIKDHYEVVGVEPGKVTARDGKTVDLRTVSLARAHELYAQKFPFLKPIGKVADPAKEEIAKKEASPEVDSSEKSADANVADGTGSARKPNLPKK